MENLLNWFKYWLPLIQGFAALASIGGAMLSWRYALKAQKARMQMTRNIIASRTIKSFESSRAYLSNIRSELINEDGKPDQLGYQKKSQEIMRHFENLLAEASAVTSELNQHVSIWEQMWKYLVDASINPTPSKVEMAAKFLGMATEQLKLAAATREIQPDA